VGAGYRAIARNGRILLASRQPLDELVGRAALIRFQTWHRTILPNEAPETYGVLMCASSRPELGRSAQFIARLCPVTEEPSELALDVGGGLVLEFRRSDG
jgi:hypothetical protein